MGLSLIIERDTKYSQRFRELVEEGGTEVIRLPPRSPNLNAYAERFVRSIKEEFLGKMIFVGQSSLRRAITEDMTHFHAERDHQGVEIRLIRLGGRLASASANRPEVCSPAPHCGASDPGICRTTAWAENGRRSLAA